VQTLPDNSFYTDNNRVAVLDKHAIGCKSWEAGALFAGNTPAVKRLPAKR
jgi:hypothetical protein